MCSRGEKLLVWKSSYFLRVEMSVDFEYFLQNVNIVTLVEITFNCNKIPHNLRCCHIIVSDIVSMANKSFI